MKKLSRKSLLSLLLAACMLAPIVSCAKERVADETTVSTALSTESVTETEEIGDGLPDTDMDGYTFSILNFNEEWLTWANTRIVVEEINGDILNDAYYERQAKLEERFHCVLHVDEVRTPVEVIGTNVTAGNTNYDSYFFNEGQMAAVLPYVLDWNSIPYLALNDAWWNPNATSVYEIHGKQIALSGNISLSAVSRSVCMVFNKNIYTDLSLDDNLYDLVHDNQWTIDRFLSIAEMAGNDVNGDGVFTADDRYGLNMGRGFKGYITSLLCGAGMNYTTMDTDGVPQFTIMQNERALSLMEKLINALGVQGFYYNEDSSPDGFKPADFFSSGHALFTQGVPHDIYKLRDMDDDIGILPMPKHDETQEQYYAAAWGGAVMVLAKTFDMANAANAGILLEALSYMGYYDIVPKYKEVALKTKTARDNESADMLDIIFNNIYFDFGTNIMLDSVIAPQVMAPLWQKKDASAIVSTFEKTAPKIYSYIEDILISIDENL